MRGEDWLERLTPHAARMAGADIAELNRADPARLAAATLEVGPIHACFARQRVDAPAVAALLDTAATRKVEAAIAALFDGEPVNRSENRPALHTALRSDLGTTAVAQAAHRQALQAREQMAALIAQLETSQVTDIVNIGIGGSDLGPRLALEALHEWNAGRFRVHFLSTADGSAVAQVLRGLDPARTAAVLVSKSFGTQETLLNGRVLRDWLGSDAQLYAVTANTARAVAFGVAPERVLPLWDWVGGRYSLWSAVGFSVAAALGMQRFEQLLRGAALMDAHVRQAPAGRNLAIRHGMLAIWNRDAMGYATHAIVPYDQRLTRLPAYLQQLVMESLGKSATQDGRALTCGSGPVIWGGAGTDVQHSFFQALHQGTDTVPMDFIGVVRACGDYPEQRRALLSNLLAQAEVLANGARSDDLQKSYPGNRPSTMLLLDELTPEALGALLALYEHSVYVQATVWGINPFDQWGVELGKNMAAGLMQALADPNHQADDPVTRALIARIHTWQQG